MEKKTVIFRVTAEVRRQVTIGRTCVEPFTKETDSTAVLHVSHFSYLHLRILSAENGQIMLSGDTDSEYYNTISPWRRDKSVWQVQ